MYRDLGNQLLDKQKSTAWILLDPPSLPSCIDKLTSHTNTS